MTASPFVEGSQLQYAWDATSLTALKTCPRKYQLSILEGWRSRGEALPLTFGSAIHKAMEHFHKRKAAGAEHDENLRTTIRETAFSPVEVDTYRNIYTLERTIVWYLDQFKDDPAEVIILANGKPAVELSFRFHTDFSVADEPVILCGHLDRVVSLNGTVWVNDYKTTKRGLYDDYFSGSCVENCITGINGRVQMKPFFWSINQIVIQVYKAESFTNAPHKLVNSVMGNL